jgi:transposase-like protein
MILPISYTPFGDESHARTTYNNISNRYTYCANNLLKRIMREIRRRTRVVGSFPDGHAALMLATARLRHIAGTKWGMKRKPPA